MKTKQPTLQNQYNLFLKELLEEKLFEPAITVHDILAEKFLVSSTYARKIVSRAVLQKVIKSSKPYTFGNGQYIYMCNEYDLGKTGIQKVAQKSRPPIYRLMELMDQNGGIISYYEGLKITASPLEKSSTKVDSLDDILTVLMKMEILYKKRDNNDVVYIIYKIEKNELDEGNEKYLMAQHFSKMVTDCNVLPDILRWLINSNLIDNSNIIYRNKKTPHRGVKHNNLVWDAFAYTRSTGINKILGAKANTIDKQTMVALDVVLANEYSDIHLDAFLNRIQITRLSVTEGERKIMPIIIYRSCPSYTMNKIRKNGIIAFDLCAIFGTRIYEILNKTQELSSLLKEDAVIEKTIESILKTINNAGQSEALKELRGTLFEFLMYPLLKSVYSNASIERGKILTLQNAEGKPESYEYDYIINSSNPPEIIFVELKGYHSGATIALGDKSTKSTLNWFFRRTLPFAEKKYANEIKNGRPAKALYITSANFWDDGKDFLAKMDKSKYLSTHLKTGYDRESLIALLKKYGLEGEIKILKKFYSTSETTNEDKYQDNKESGKSILTDLEYDLPF